VEKMLSHPNLINNKNRVVFYAQRTWHPLVQMKFEAETVVEPADSSGHGRITFPNGSVREFIVESKARE